MSAGSDGHGWTDEVRRTRLIALLGPHAQPRGGHDDGSPVGAVRMRLGELCGLSISEAGVSGAGITVMGSVDAGLAGHRDQLWATGPLTRRLEDLQLTAGEGPCLDAYDGGAPVLAGNLAAEQSRWPGFGPEAIAAGAAAVFSFPLQVGVVRLGTLDLCRDVQGPLSSDQLADALVLAGMATEMLLELVGDREPETAELLSETVGWLPDVHAEVHQASGMVSAQEGIDVGEALLRIRAYAFAESVPIDEVARRIVDRDLVLANPRD